MRPKNVKGKSSEFYIISIKRYALNLFARKIVLTKIFYATAAKALTEKGQSSKNNFFINNVT